MRIGGWVSAVLAAAVLLAGGCAPFTYDGVGYQTRQAATDAARADIERQVLAAPEPASQIAGSVLIVLPSREIIRRHGVIAGPLAGGDTAGYIVEVLELGYRGRADVVKASRIFASVDVAQAADVEAHPAAGHDYKLWLLGTGVTEWQWYLARAGATAKEKVTIDPALPRQQWSAAFNAELLRAAAVLGGTVVAMPAKPAQAPLAAQPAARMPAQPGGLTAPTMRVPVAAEPAAPRPPKEAAAYYNRGLAYQNMGNAERALEDFGEAIRLFPAYTDAIQARDAALKAKAGGR